MSKLPCVSLFQIFSAMSAKYYWNWFTVGKVITKIKRVNFFIETQCNSNSLATAFQPASDNSSSLFSTIQSAYAR